MNIFNNPFYACLSCIGIVFLGWAGLNILAVVYGMTIRMDVAPQPNDDPAFEAKPEYLPDCRLVLYKWLVFNNGAWYSPVQRTRWDVNRIIGYGVDMESYAGIYGFYTLQLARKSCYGGYREVDGETCLVKLACEGDVVWHEVGARVEKAEIIEVIHE
jgi:hypothetical protein